MLKEWKETVEEQKEEAREHAEEDQGCGEEEATPKKGSGKKRRGCGKGRGRGKIPEVATSLRTPRKLVKVKLFEWQQMAEEMHRHLGNNVVERPPASARLYLLTAEKARGLWSHRALQISW
uniref:Uncharacterized protein n=1 Tax=Meloidogyne hapla TaxID=6305 RepID=A0A1I8BF65_MELHA